jgi:hypothetical protein
MEAEMTWRDKLEIGLKENAPYRKDNLPLTEVIGPELPQGALAGSAEIPHARGTSTQTPTSAHGGCLSEDVPPGRSCGPPGHAQRVTAG